MNSQPVAEFSERLRKQEKIEEDSFVVLLATSEQQISETLSCAFKNRKIEFLTVNTIKDMLIAMSETQINLMIIDSNITRLEGLETLLVVKKLKPQVRVMVISDDLSLETRKALVNEGVIYQIQKPMTSDQISRVVTTVVTKLHPGD